MRHDHMRDIFAEHLKDLFWDVETEPLLTPLDGEVLQPRTANSNNDATSDIRVNGFWTPHQNAFFDVRIFYPLARTYREQNITTLLRRFEAEKKRQYNDRIINVERGSFTPLVCSTSGVIGGEATITLKRMALKISHNRTEPYSVIMGLLRARLSFSLIRSAIVCLRGTRRRMVAPEVNNAVLIMQRSLYDWYFVLYFFFICLFDKIDELFYFIV